MISATDLWLPLTDQVKALEAIVNKGGRVVENDVNNLIESLMNEMIKLDAVVADGDVKQQRRAQVRSIHYLSNGDCLFAHFELNRCLIAY